MGKSLEFKTRDREIKSHTLSAKRFLLFLFLKSASWNSSCMGYEQHPKCHIRSTHKSPVRKFINLQVKLEIQKPVTNTLCDLVMQSQNNYLVNNPIVKNGTAQFFEKLIQGLNFIDCNCKAKESTFKDSTVIEKNKIQVRTLILLNLIITFRCNYILDCS